jgi:hypothetical protein
LLFEVFNRLKADKVEIKEITQSLDIKLNWSLLNIPNELKINSSILGLKRDGIMFQNITLNCKSLNLDLTSLFMNLMFLIFLRSSNRLWKYNIC